MLHPRYLKHFIEFRLIILNLLFVFFLIFPFFSNNIVKVQLALMIIIILTLFV